MIRLNTPTEAKVLAAYVMPASAGMKPNGVVLAETATDWVTWNIYWDGGVWADLENEGQLHEAWECETGHYFQKSMHPSQGDPKTLAEFDFGLRLRHLLTQAALRGIDDGKW